ncbi:hypothetical protein [Pedobacter sp. Leaf170]|uniref:hypothetical protein n=1 Tax=Pedobacter sp. Leaf170 TaxID=2876558 RepID=UPI001E2C2EDC|nr:hypothetical protein [Pedobacter sp. Leaf170]
MFSTYKQAVLNNYDQRKTAGTLPLRLQSPTPASVKEHLMQYLEQHFDARKDRIILEAFFGNQNDAEGFAKRLSRMEINKFKSVIKFLKGKTTNPEDKQVHLAALLTNFERPYEFGKDYSEHLSAQLTTEEKEGTNETSNVGQVSPKSETDVDIEDREAEGKKGSLEGQYFNENIGADDSEDAIDDGPEIEKSTERTASNESDPETTASTTQEPIKGEEEERNSWWKDEWVKKSVACLLLVIPISAGFLLKNQIGGNLNGEQCMYWKEDRYVAVSCDAKLKEDVEKVALDTILLNHFRMITKADTITERSIGKIWYLKHEKKFEYFTIRGNHPILRRKLSRLSDLIYRNEIESRRLENAKEF